MSEIAFVCMPFASIKRPALGISLLKSALQKKNILSDICYFNLRMAERMGHRNYTQFSENTPTTAMAGEWIFSGALFGSSAESDGKYMSSVLLNQHRGSFTREYIIELYLHKQSAPGFIQECLKSRDWSEYKIVGFTSSYQQNCASLALAKQIKQHYPDIIIVFGGANCEAEMGINLHKTFPFIDYICSGEGENAFPLLAEKILAGKDIPEIDGIIARKNGETVVPGKIISAVIDLDNIPFAQFDDYFAQLQSHSFADTIDPVIPFETSRGCWWGEIHHCTFCGLNGLSMGFRSKTGERALEELLFLYKKYGTKFQVVDNILDNNYFKTFLPALARLKLNAGLFYEVKANLKKEQIAILSQAGITHLQPGIESFSNAILQLMKKGTTFLQNIQTMKWCKESGIALSWNMLCGFPGEKKEEYEQMEKLLPLLYHFDPPGSCGLVRVDRFSPYFANPSSFGITRIYPHEAYNYIFPVSPDRIYGIAYYFNFEYPFATPPLSYIKPVLKITEDWLKLAGKASLFIEKTAAGSIITDTRDPENPKRWLLNEQQTMLYFFCDKIQTEKAIQNYLSEKFCNISPSNITLLLNVLIAHGLMVKDGDRFLGIATHLQNKEAYLKNKRSPDPEKMVFDCALVPLMPEPAHPEE